MSPAETRRMSRPWIAALLAINALGVVMVISALSGAHAAPGTVVSVGSGSTTVGGTTTIAVTITVDPDDDEFNAFDLTLSFDPALLEATNVTPGADWQFTAIPGGNPVVDNGAGTIDVVGLTFGPECGSGCTLFNVTYQGQANGLSSLNISGQLAGAGLTITPGAINAGSLQVGSNETATSTSGETATSTTDVPTPATGTATSTSDVPTPATGTATSTSEPGTATSTSEPGTATATSTGTASETPDGTTTPTGTVSETPDGTTTPTGSETPTGTETATGTPTPTGTPGPDPDLFEVFVANAAKDGTD